MDEPELKSILSNEINMALGYDGGKLSTERRRALEYYEGMPFGDEVDGQSQVIARNVLESVEWVLPALIRIFVPTSGNVVEFEPYQPNEEPMADQATQYVNYIMTRDNDFFKICYTWFKDSLIQKLGYIQVSYVDERTYNINHYTGLNDLEFQQLTAGDDVDVLVDNSYPNPDPNFQWFTEDSPEPFAPQLHDCVLRVWTTEGRVRIENIAPEEILVSRRAPETALDGKHFVCRRQLKRVTDLREMGYDEDLIEEAMGFDEQEFNSERVARFYPDDDWPMTGDRTDPAMREIWLEESYIPIDYDGDGIAELRRIVSAGAGQIIFINELIDDIPIVAICPIPMPHKHIGLSMADLTMDLQRISSTLMRQVLNNLYVTNNPRVIVEETACTDETYDDLLTSRSGGIVRVANKDGIVPFTIPFIAGETMPVLEYLEQVQEVRTGISRQNQTLNPDDLNKFASGTAIGLAQQSAAQRVELIARIFAGSIKRVAELVLGLVVRHQQVARMIRITGSWVPFDPRTWRESMDVNCDVALGSGNRDAVIQHLTSLLGIQQQIVMAQKGFGGLVSAANIYSLLEDMQMNLGLRKSYFSDPTQSPPTNQGQQNPEMMKAQSDIQANSQKMQADIGLAHAKAQTDMQISQQQAQQQMELSERQAQHEMQMEIMKAKTQIEIEKMREQSKIELEQMRMAIDVAKPIGNQD